MQPEAEQRIRAEAERRGVDPDKAVAHARSLAAKSAPPADGGKDAEPKGDAPLVDKLLIGHLPFVKVRELRTMLGLPRIPDDEMTCGEFAAKHGGAAAAPATDAETPA